MIIDNLMEGMPTCAPTALPPHRCLALTILRSRKGHGSHSSSYHVHCMSLSRQTPAHGCQEPFSTQFITSLACASCSPCHFLALDSRLNRLVLTIRGSLEVGDLLTDLHAKPIALDIAGAKCHVHEGMLRAATYVHCNTADALASAASLHPGAPLFVTGHSLGGGVAALVTLLLRQPNGSPPTLQVRVCLSCRVALQTVRMSQARRW
jgi:hypothetical protein